MRRTVGLFVVAMALGILMVSGVALAKTFTCEARGTCEGTNKADKITGTNQADTIRAKKGNDKIDARGGADDIDAGQGRDTVRGGGGNDTIDIADGDNDLVDCGAGNDDTVIFNVGDRPVPGTEPNGNCENFEEA
jgi:Ca2+-binding RTX toxin-like protein